MSEELLKYSTYLVSKTSFLSGMGQVLDTSGSYQRYNQSESGIEADSKATFLDWLVVGDDLHAAVRNFDQK